MNGARQGLGYPRLPLAGGGKRGSGERASQHAGEHGPSGERRGLGRRDVLRGGAYLAGSAAIGSSFLSSLVGGTPRLTDLGDFQTVVKTAVSPPPIITRAQWGADESLGDRVRFFAPLRK